MHKIDRRSLWLFDSWARFYDLPIFSWFFKFFYNEVEDYLGDINGKKVLSVGCGTGTLEIKLAEKFPNSKIVGLDLSPKMVKQARLKSKTLANVEFIEGNSESLPFNKKSFDVVLCIHSFHHYSNQEIALQEAFRVLKKNGNFIMIEGLKDSLTGKLKILFNKTFLEPGTRHYSSNQLKKLIQKSGFKKVNIRRITPVYGLITCFPEL
ncbi:methyltransferase domain-containing protein [Candidatus Microgenomates bacterium]|nr:methyltransferase domain-containing protein [Candidatus Microgenomates bacterium]